MGDRHQSLGERVASMARIQLIARHTMKPGEQDAVLAALSELIAAARQEPGNLAFEVFRGVEDELSYVLLERYASRQALEAHRESRHFKKYLIGEIAPRLSCRTIEEYDVED
jgi:quinol monooxygenase YgiN